MQPLFQSDTGPKVDISAEKIGQSMFDQYAKVRLSIWWTRLITLSIVGLCALFGNPPALIWYLIGLQIVCITVSDAWFRFGVRTSSDPYHSVGKNPLLVLSSFTEGILWGLMMLPFTKTLGSDVASTFVCTVLVVTVSFSSMVSALNARWLISFCTGFLGALIPQCIIYMSTIGPLPLIATLSLIPALFFLSQSVRNQMREIVITKLENEKLSARLSSALAVSNRLARTDTLTGLLNRRAFETEAGQLSQNQWPPSKRAIILVDLDHFKSINDTFGHSRGDEVLKEAAKCIADTINTHPTIGKASCPIARWGGEEFIAMVQVDELLSAMQLSEQVRLALIEARQEHWSNEMLVTGSFGVAIWDADQELQDAINKADQAMYSAKVAGRNRSRGYHAAGCFSLEFLQGEMRAKIA